MFIAKLSTRNLSLFSFTGSSSSFAVALDLVNHDIIPWYMEPVEVQSIFSFLFFLFFSSLVPCESASLISEMFLGWNQLLEKRRKKKRKRKKKKERENTYNRKVYPIDRLHHLLNSPVTPVALCVKWTDFNMRSKCFCSFTFLLGVHFLSIFLLTCNHFQFTAVLCYF